MDVTIFYRNSFEGGDGWTCEPRKISIGDNCPECGGPRGTPSRFTFWENGQSHTADIWHNECGHLDQYPEVWLEHLRRIEGYSNPTPKKA